MNEPLLARTRHMIVCIGGFSLIIFHHSMLFYQKINYNRSLSFPPLDPRDKYTVQATEHKFRATV